MSRRTHTLALLWLSSLLVGCALDTSSSGDDVDEDEYVDPGIGMDEGKADGATSVGALGSSTCSTIPVRGLSLQIAEELRCLAPGVLVPLEPDGGIEFASAAVLPYLESDTADALRAAAGEAGAIVLNSGLRSLAQQYLLYRWYQLGRCGIRAAARPGHSNHETGRAVDVANRSQARAALLRQGFSTLSFDPVHFDHLDSPDLRDVGVQAFQRLWNRNHPEDPLDEDGVYGPQTAARLARAPSGGFAVSGCKPD